MRIQPAILAASSSPVINLRANAGVYQDSAGTTAATANNDPVGNWHNQNGDNYSALQSTSGSRPLLQTAVPSILFDGTDDYLVSSNTLSHTVGSVLIVFTTGATAFASRGAQVLFSSADTGSANNWFEIGISSTGSIYVESNAGGTKHTVNGFTTLLVSTTYSIAVVYDGTDYYVSLNGAEENPLTISNIGTIAWFGHVSGADNTVVGGTVTSAGLVRPFLGQILEVIVYSYDITA